MKRTSRNRRWISRSTLASIALTLAASAAIHADAAAAVIRGPYLQRGTPTSAVVRWRTDNATNSRVYYGPSPGNLTLFADDPQVTTEHEVVVTGLQPETTYYYGIGSTSQLLVGDDADHFFVTPPPAMTAPPTRIWVLGDSGTANGNAAAVRDAYYSFTAGQYTDLWLMLGDNAYDDGTDSEYQDAVFDMYPEMLRQTFLWSTLGNHDGHSADSGSQTGPYYDIFTLPRQAEAGGLPSGTEAYYSFDFGNIHFICLDSYDTNRAPGGAMMNWMANDLANTLADWIIAFWHHPPYSKGSHDSDGEGRLIDMRAYALPILEAGGVDLVLTGHSHSYERSFLLDGHYGFSWTLTPEMIVDGGSGREDSDGAYNKTIQGTHEGAVYIVAGSSGQTSGGSLNHPAMFISLNQLGSLVLDVDGERLDARFLRSNGTVSDYFTINKEVPAPPGSASNPDPTDGAIDVSAAPVLNWTPGSQTDTHDVYLGSDPDLGPEDFQASQSDNSFAPGLLTPFATYYWRIDEVNELGTATGEIWSFTTGNQLPVTFHDLTTATTDSSASFDLDKPNGTTEGDLLLAIVAKERGGQLFAPPGWSIIDEGTDMDDKVRLGVFYLIAGAAEPTSYTFSSSEDKKAMGAILRYCCPDSVEPLDAVAVAFGDSAQPSAPSVVTTQDGAMVLRIFAAKDDDLAAEPYPAGHDGRFVLQSGGKVSGGSADVVQPAAGVTGSAAFQLTTAKEWRAVTVALAPGVIPCDSLDSDDDGVSDCDDGCPEDPDKVEPGVCGCGEPDIDSDDDGMMDCDDPCPNHPSALCLCPADLNVDGLIGVGDLVTIILEWGPCPPGDDCVADINLDGLVGAEGLIQVILTWGPCM